MSMILTMVARPEKHQRVRRVKPELYQDMTFEKERG